MLFAATPSGVYRVFDLSSVTIDRVLDTGARQITIGPDNKQVYAATDEGLYVSRDDGASWETLDVPTPDIYSLLVTEDCLYAGARPAAIYTSTEDGDTWSELTGFNDLAADSAWPTNPHRDEAWVRTLATPRATSDLLLAGIEVGGLAISTDSGTSWQECEGVPDDVHQVLCVSSDTWVVSCGTGGPSEQGGVYQTDDRGKTWARRDTGSRPYVRESCYPGRLYTAANRSAPLWNPPDATVLVEDETQQLVSVPYPNEPHSFVISWATTSDTILGGTNDGRILRETDDGWQSLGTIPVGEDDQQASGVTSLAATSSGP